MSGSQGAPESQDAQDYAEQLPMRMGAPAQPAQSSPTQNQGIDTDTTTRPDRLPAQLSAPVNDPNAPLLSPTGFDSTTVGDTDKTNWSDYAKAAWQRVEGMGSAALGAASMTARKMGADPDTVQHIEQMRQGVAQSIEDSVNSMSPAAQKALHASVFGGQDENGEHIPTPGEVGWGRFLALNAASFVPDAVLAAVTARAGGAAALPILGSIYGTMQAGEGYSKLVDEVDKSKPEDWNNSPAMQALLQKGLSFTDAKKQIVDHAANQLGALNFGIGALTGAGGMGLLMKGPLGSIGKSLISRLGLSAGEGAVTMGLQSGGQEAAQENATNQAGLTNGFDTDKLARATASGALGGLVVGAAGGALHGAHDAPAAQPNPRGEETATPGPSTGLVSPELQAALNLGDAGTGYVRGQPQGELFRTTEQANAGGNQNLPPASGGPPPAAMGGEQGALDVTTPQPAKMAPPGFAGQEQQGQLFRTQADMQANPQQPIQRPQPTQVQPELMATPGTVGANPQGQLFRTADEANQPAPAPPTPPTVKGTVSVGRASDGMARGDLLDALKTMPNQDPKALARMTKGDLATAYDKASAPGQRAQPTQQVVPSTPEPQRDIDAQMAAVADKTNPKDAMFVAKGSPEPSSRPKGVFKSTRDEGTLYTTNAKKVAAFRKSDLSDDSMGKILGYTESKADAVASGNPTVVQAKDAQGAVAHEQLASPEGVPAAQAAATERMPEGGSVTVATPEQMQNRRAQEAAQAPVEAPTTHDNPKTETPPTPSSAAARPDNSAKGLDPAHLKVLKLIEDGHEPVGSGQLTIMRLLQGLGLVNVRDDGEVAITDKGIVVRQRAEGMTEAPKSAAPQTAGDKLRAKRAAQKAAMAPPGERMKGTVATVEAPVGKGSEKELQTSDTSPRTHDEAMADVEKGVREFKVQPLKKGADITRAMNTVIQELTDRLKGTKTEGDVTEAVAKWARSNTSPLPGTTTRRIDIGDHVVQLLSGKSVDEYSGRADRVRSELAREPAQEVRYEKEANREDISEGERTVTHAVGEPTTVVEKEPTKIVDQLPHWLGRVLSGDMSVHEAHETYGLPKGNGRPRKYATFADYIDDRIRMAEDPKVEEDLRNRLSELKDMPTSQAKSAETNRINQLLETTGKNAADKLRALKEELDPVKAAADEVAPVRSADKLKARLAERKADNARQANADEGKSLITRLTVLAPKVNEWMKANGYDEKFGDGILKIDRNKITRIIEEHLAGGHADFDRIIDRMSSFKADRYTWDEKVPEMQKWVTDAHNWLEKIDQTNEKLVHQPANKQPPELGRIATALHDPRLNSVVTDMLDSGKPHTLHDYLYAIGKDDAVNRETPELASLARRMMTLAKDDIPVDTNTTFQFANGDTAFHGGLFRPGVEPGTGAIGVNKRGVSSTVETLLHEGLHAITAHYIESLPYDHPDLMALDTMRAELQRVFEVTEKTLAPEDTLEISYALENNHELHTMLMTNPALQRLAAAARPSFEFQSKMKSLGYGLDMVKSVWAAFTNLVRRALGLKGPMNARDASLMDYALKPLQDITERAAEFNRSPPEGMTFATEHALPDFNARARQEIDDVLKTVDLKTAGDKTRTGALASATTDGIVKWNTPLFESRDKESPGNAIKDYHKADEAIGARKKAFSDKYADQINDWAKSIQGKERDDLAGLLVDASTANVRLGANADNSHLTTVGQQKQLADLQARYGALSPKARAAYDASHKLQDAMYAEEREARLSAMVKGVMKGATDDQLNAVRDVAKGRKSLDAFLSDPDNSAVAGKFGTEWNSVRALVKGIAQIHKLGFVDGDYFPLRRYGDYVLSYGEKGTEAYGMERFATIAKAEARRTELLTQKAGNLSQVQSLRESHMRDVVSMPAMDEVLAAMAKRGDLKPHIDEMHDLMASVVMQHATHSAGARARLRREGVLGASKDVEKVVAQDYLATAARIGYLEHGVDRAQAIQRMQAHADMLGMDGAPGEQRAAQAVVREIQKRTASSDDGDSIVDKILRKASSFGYIQSLQSFSHMFTSTFEAHTNSIPLLGARHGPVQASVALTKALKDSLPVLGVGAKNVVKAVGKGLRANDWNLSTVVRDQMVKNGADAGHMNKLFNALNGAGLLDHTFVRELARMANPSNQRLGKVAGWWGKFMDLNAAGAHAMDVANKSAIAKAAFDLELRKTGDVNKAVDYAMDMARSAMPNYNSTNKARIARGLLAPAMQFKNYGIHMYSMLGNLAHEWTHGATPDARKEARNALAGIVIMHTLTAGVIAGSPLGDILRWVGGFYDLVTGETKPHDYENDVRSMIADVAGPELGEIISRGVPHAAGFDIHRRVGLSNLLEPPELDSFNAAGFAKAGMTALTGAAGEDATTLVGGLAKMRQGNLAGAIQDITPREFRDVYKAYRLSDVGVTDSKGQTVMAPGSMSGMDFVYQALGFQPSDVTEFREGRNAVLEARQEASTEHSRLIQSWVRADPDDRADMMESIQAFNVRDPGQKITADTLLKAAKQHQDAMKQANAATFGLTLPKKARGYLSDAGSFANTGQ